MTLISKLTALAALSAGLVACTGGTVISRIDQNNTYEPTQVASAVRNGVLPAAVFGAIPNGITPEALAARLSLPGWLGNTRMGTGAPRGYRLVLVFNPVAPVDADALCAAPQDVPVRTGGGEFAIQGAWCFWDTAASRGYLTAASTGGDGGLEATAGKLISVLLPSKSTQSDLSSKGDFPL